ncbi:MAG: DNA methylase, partial [Acidimicrobiaceae bacterium]|nr:DNA methylase [Acidimicrobiaceae bacterium]
MTVDIAGGKGSVFYRAHSYHTKVPVEGLKQLIEHYTDPGDVVLDPFCGSGQTGVAAVLTGRHAVLSDLSPAAVHIARGYTARVDPDRFKQVASELLAGFGPLELDLYGVPGGRIEYTVWSDLYRCSRCE